MGTSGFGSFGSGIAACLSSGSWRNDLPLECPFKVVDAFASCPIPEVARLGRTLKQWKDAFLAYFDTDGASNGGCEAVNGLIELHRRIARGFRNRENYRLRMLLIAGKLDPSPPPQL